MLILATDNSCTALLLLPATAFEHLVTCSAQNIFGAAPDPGADPPLEEPVLASEPCAPYH